MAVKAWVDFETEEQAEIALADSKGIVNIDGKDIPCELSVRK